MSIWQISQWEETIEVGTVGTTNPFMKKRQGATWLEIEVVLCEIFKGSDKYEVNF